MTVVQVFTSGEQAQLQFGHAQRAWDDQKVVEIVTEAMQELQFGHAQRAWDDMMHQHVHGSRQVGFNSATPRGRGMTITPVSSSAPESPPLQFGHAQRAWDD